MRVLGVVRELPGLHIRGLERLVGTRRVSGVVRVLERRGLVRTVWLFRVLGGQLKRVKAVFPVDSLDPGLDFLSTWIKTHDDVVVFVDAVEDRGWIVLVLHGCFHRELVRDLEYSLGCFGFRVKYPRFPRRRGFIEYVVVYIPRIFEGKVVGEYRGSFGEA